MLVYNYRVDRWAKFDQDHTLIGQLVTPDTTLEELDSVASQLDDHTVSFDADVSRWDLQLATATTDHKIATFSGPNLAASGLIHQRRLSQGLERHLFEVSGQSLQVGL